MLISLPGACRGRNVVRLSANSPHMCCKELALEGEHSSLTAKRSAGYTMLMRSSKSETAVHSRHCPGDVAVRMHEVQARPLHMHFCT